MQRHLLLRGAPIATPIRLKVLLRQRHWQTYRTFKIEYDKIAREVDPELMSTWPSRAQFHRWLSGELKGLPYPDHCRILETMFPGWSAEQLFSPMATAHTDEQPAESGVATTPTMTSGLTQTIADGLRSPETERNDWGVNTASLRLDALTLNANARGPTERPGGTSDPVYVLGRRLLALGRVMRLSVEEIGQLATLAGNVVNLGLDVSIDIAQTGEATLTYRHELLNLTSRPLARVSHDLWFEHTDGALRLSSVSPRGRKLTIMRLHEAANLANFACHIDPPAQSGETVTVEFACAGPQFVKDHYWRQRISRYTRHLTIRLRHERATLVDYSAVEENTDGSEIVVTDAVIRDDDGPDVALTVTSDYLSPNQYVTLRWKVSQP